MAFNVTQCPSCDSTFNTNARILDSAGGKVRCGACLRVFVAAENFVAHGDSESLENDEESVFVGNNPDDYFDPSSFLTRAALTEDSESPAEQLQTSAIPHQAGNRSAPDSSTFDQENIESDGITQDFFNAIDEDMAFLDNSKTPATTQQTENENTFEEFAEAVASQTSLLDLPAEDEVSDLTSEANPEVEEAEAPVDDSTFVTPITAGSPQITNGDPLDVPQFVQSIYEGPDLEDLFHEVPVDEELYGESPFVEVDAQEEEFKQSFNEWSDEPPPESGLADDPQTTEQESHQHTPPSVEASEEISDIASTRAYPPAGEDQQQALADEAVVSSELFATPAIDTPEEIDSPTDSYAEPAPITPASRPEDLSLSLSFSMDHSLATRQAELDSEDQLAKPDRAETAIELPEPMADPDESAADSVEATVEATEQLPEPTTELDELTSTAEEASAAPSEATHYPPQAIEPDEPLPTLDVAFENPGDATEELSEPIAEPQQPVATADEVIEAPAEAIEESYAKSFEEALAETTAEIETPVEDSQESEFQQAVEAGTFIEPGSESASDLHATSVDQLTEESELTAESEAEEVLQVANEEAASLDAIAAEYLPGQTIATEQDSTEAIRARALENTLEDEEALEAIPQENLATLGEAAPPLQLTTKRDIRWLPRIAYALVTIMLAGMIAAQFLWQRMQPFSQIAQLRPLYEWVCERTGCELPEYSNIDAIRSGGLAVRSHPELDNGLAVNITFRNGAAFPQAFPILILSFNTPNNDIVALREFAPNEYLDPGLQAMTLMPVMQPVQVNLELIDPGPDAVNYTLAFRRP